MTEDEFRWAEALQIEKWKGRDEGAVYIAERVAALTLAGDAAGAERFRQIAHRYEQLLAGARGSRS